MDEAREVVREVQRRLLRRLRAEVPRRPLTQRRLAQRLGLSREQVIALESGRSALTESALARYLVALDVPISSFYRMAARIAEEVEPRDVDEEPPRQSLSSLVVAHHLPPGGVVLWHRETSREVLVLLQLPDRGEPRSR